MSDRKLNYFRGQSPGFRWSDYLRQPHVLETVEEANQADPAAPTPQVPGPFLGEYSGGNVQPPFPVEPVVETPEEIEFLGEPSGINVEPPVQEEQLDEDVVEIYTFRNTSDFKEDLTLLQGKGFVIDTSQDGKLGSGNFGVVYRGYYGIEFQDFDSVDPALRFAVKVIDFDEVENFYTEERTRHFRESFESEKYIMTQIKHKNCVKIHYIVLLGEQKHLPFGRHPEETYQSPDRAYLFLEYADGGTLERWLSDNKRIWLPSTRIKFIRDLFSGMRYLHHQKILHGDVHVGNILLFNEGDQMTAKWTDFGLSRIASEEQFTIRITEQYFYKNCRSELNKMIAIFAKILRNRMKSMETPEETYQLDEYQRMVGGLTYRFSTIDELFDQLRNVLDED